jgi:WD40 repeat protein
VAVCALAVDPGGKRLYSAGADNTVRVWMLTDGSCLRSTNLFEMTHEDANSYFVAPQRAYSHSFAAQQHKVYGMSLSHDAARCFAGCSDKDIKVWDTKTGTLKLALKGHEGPVGAMAAFHTSSTRLLTGSGDATLRAWDLARNRQGWHFSQRYSHNVILQVFKTKTVQFMTPRMFHVSSHDTPYVPC